jgi:hypothetical protein
MVSARLARPGWYRTLRQSRPGTARRPHLEQYIRWMQDPLR